MATFTVAMVVVPYALGQLVMSGTNPQKETDLERQLRSRATLEHKMLAKANRERLAVLLSETEKGNAGDSRYAAALRGESLGTHSRGTTTGAQGIKESSK
ncbi:g6990 [Coccomyxa elongata]